MFIELTHFYDGNKVWVKVDSIITIEASADKQDVISVELNTGNRLAVKESISYIVTTINQLHNKRNTDSLKSMNNITKDNVLAAILSFFIPGLGQMLIQQRNKEAIWFFLVWILTAILCITLPLTVIVWLWAVYDALVYQPSTDTTNTTNTN